MTTPTTERGSDMPKSASVTSQQTGQMPGLVNGMVIVETSVLRERATRLIEAMRQEDSLLEEAIQGIWSELAALRELCDRRMPAWREKLNTMNAIVEGHFKGERILTEGADVWVMQEITEQYRLLLLIGDVEREAYLLQQRGHARPHLTQL
ncbi:hypothetical protein GLOTRDRAFT_97092 [Gloeophyllum trabeum ATCC 11539]|uniref:Uncharacterized protein n=1 Tax=Gloeophyllum trabeum (strain ATCC 11539 / FP-39264 / Madison 617) TaxID=670483 RepID=S7PSI0_GLOTA|nr:uncharacterized protein GLOTRDRAFT_97092 [Gloeophyllum trabeum ATCC 11539]EPQ50373.1 hypothetical protein GLOTRDRAFT_97092 [Gloeophyllum trabeum ATCC 11539]